MGKLPPGPALLAVFPLMAAPDAARGGRTWCSPACATPRARSRWGAGVRGRRRRRQRAPRLRRRAWRCPAVSDGFVAGTAIPSKKKAPETDLEAATILGDRALWLTSHGRNSQGKPQPSRLRLFATTGGSGSPLRLIGQPYTHLLDDLLRAPALASFGLQAAAQKAPKEPGGSNIEGMTAQPDGRSVIIGFRNPVPQGKALVLPLLNPLEMLDGQSGQVRCPPAAGSRRAEHSLDLVLARSLPADRRRHRRRDHLEAVHLGRQVGPPSSGDFGGPGRLQSRSVRLVRGSLGGSAPQ